MYYLDFVLAVYLEDVPVWRSSYGAEKRNGETINWNTGESDCWTVHQLRGKTTFNPIRETFMEYSFAKIYQRSSETTL
jgi:hypothetical protein